MKKGDDNHIDYTTTTCVEQNDLNILLAYNKDTNM